MRRTATLVAALAAALGLVAAGCGGEDGAAPDTTASTVTETAETTPATETAPAPKPKPKPEPKPKPTRIVIVVEQGRVRGGIARPTVKKGTRIVVVVRTEAGEEVHVHGYDVTKRVVAGKATRIALVATIPGRFEVELHHPDLVLAELSVTP